jgi:hypothetical protein
MGCSVSASLLLSVLIDRLDRMFALNALLLKESPLVSNIANSQINKVIATDNAAHDWYRFVLSFPPHLVREYLERFSLSENDRVLDPFCGTGTTLVECKKLGISSIGIEAHPMSHFASQTKTNWNVDPEGLEEHAKLIAAIAKQKLLSDGVADDVFLHLASGADKFLDRAQTYRTLPPDRLKLLLTNSISPLPLHKVLVLLETMEEECDDRYHQHERLALAKALVSSIGNLHFGPEVGIGKIKKDASVVTPWLIGIRSMARDLRELHLLSGTPSVVYLADSRHLQNLLEPNSISAVITSPPYPNEKDYTRTTRLESVILEFFKDKAELQKLKRTLLRSNTRNVYKGDDDDQWISSHDRIEKIAQLIEKRRIELGKTSGFERLYHRVTKLYFGGMARHLSQLRGLLRPGAYLAYVVGDQASYLRVMIRTGQLLGEIATKLGYQIVAVDLFRTRLATATKEQLREEVLVLHWPDKSKRVFEPPAKYNERKSIMSKQKVEAPQKNRYVQIIEEIFDSHYKKGKAEISFKREEIESVARKLKIKLPKNLGDLIYSFRYRSVLPERIRDKAPAGREWIIRPAGRSKYVFALVSGQSIIPSSMLAETKVPDSTPGLISLYALNDEQALLARLRYNRLIDIFTGISCYSLQSHLRTALPSMGQIETDEIYIGLDKRGVHYVFPVQAKGGNDKINIVQIEQDFAMCAAKFPSLVCRAIGAQFMENNLIALFEFENKTKGIKVVSERHYQLVLPEEVTPELLSSYKDRLPEG